VTLEARGRWAAREHDARAWLAWHTAALTRMDHRRFPRSPDALTGRRQPLRRNQSRNEFWGILSAAALSAGGKVTRREAPTNG